MKLMSVSMEATVAELVPGSLAVDPWLSPLDHPTAIGSTFSASSFSKVKLSVAGGHGEWDYTAPAMGSHGVSLSKVSVDLGSSNGLVIAQQKSLH